MIDEKLKICIFYEEIVLFGELTYIQHNYKNHKIVWTEVQKFNLWQVASVGFLYKQIVSVLF